MMDWKKLGRRLLFPHPVAVGLLLPASLVMMLWSVPTRGPNDPVTIAAYALSFYGLVILCCSVPAILRRIARFRRENAYYLRYRSDVRLRMNLSLYIACGFNAVYAALQLGLGVCHRSAWFYAMAGYYLLLGVMRLSLVRLTRHYAPGEEETLEWRRYRLCGVLLLVMNLALMIFTLYFVYRIRTFRHHEITTIAMAAYTFASLTMAIINVVRCRQYGSPAYSAAKEIALVSAAVSMLTLENAMLTAFGQESSEGFRQIILGATGAAVILVVQGIALHMIVRATQRLRTIKSTIKKEV